MKKRLWIVVLAVMLQPVSHAGTPAVVEVFMMSDQSHTLTGLEVMEDRGIRVVIHVVDDLHLAEAELSARLPEGVDAAKAAAGDVMRSMTADDEQRFVSAWFALQRAHHHNIHKAPAVVFDSTAVVYGERDMSRALAIWQEANE